MRRIEKKFQELHDKKKCAFVAYICAGDPDYKTSLALLKAMPSAGADIIELGVPFLDPAGDGPIIETAAKRAISAGMSLKKTLAMAKEFRKTDQKTPLIFMTYYNPILKFGVADFFTEAAKSGVDGALIVDLPLEENDEISAAVKKSSLDLIGLIAPTTNQNRAKKIAEKSSGFLYLISMLGITGTKSAKVLENKKNLRNLRQISNSKIVIGFGIQTPDQAEEFSKIGVDGVVVGSAIVKEIDKNFSGKKSSAEIVAATIEKLHEFSKKIKNK